MSKHNSFKRIKKRIFEELYSTFEISKKLGFIKGIQTFIAKIDIQILNRNGYKESKNTEKRLIKKHNIMLEYFQKELKDYFISYDFDLKKKTINSDEDKSNTIWICWWQGLDNAPIIVKKCIESIKRCAKNHEVVVLTLDNYKDYVNFPQILEEKRENGIMSLTHFSDLLRLSLLGKYGGLWLDSTFFCKSDGDLEKIFSYPIWSIKRPGYGHVSVACGMFANYSLYCDYNNRWIFDVIKDFYVHYWETYDFLIDYLTTDYLIVLAQRFNNEIKDAFSSIPDNNKNCDELYKILNQKYSDEEWNKLSEHTDLFKLSWKAEYSIFDSNNNETFYSKIINDKLL